MKPYIRPMPRDWWLQRLPYLSFMAREVSSIFVAAYVVVFMVMLQRISQGPEAYQTFLDSLQSSLAILFHIVALAFALIHTLSWFSPDPQSHDAAYRRGSGSLGAHLGVPLRGLDCNLRLCCLDDFEELKNGEIERADLVVLILCGGSRRRFSDSPAHLPDGNCLAAGTCFPGV